MYGHPIAKEMEAFWATHGGRYDDPKWHAFLDDFSYLLRSKMDEQREAHDNKGRFGMSKAGGCTRAAALKLQDAESKPFSGSTRVTFWNGHMIEVLGLATLRAIGLPVYPSTEDGGQWPASIDPFMHSYTDGVIGNDPRLGNVPAALSVKSMGYKMSGKTREGWKRWGFAQYPFDGVKKANPKYWAQMQAEMHGLTGVRQALFLAVAKDIIKVMEGDPYLGPKGNGSLTFYAELVPYDVQFVADALLPTWGEAWDVNQRGELPRPLVITASGDYVELEVAGSDEVNKKLTGSYNDCGWCDLRDACEASKLTGQLRASIEQAEATNA